MSTGNRPFVTDDPWLKRLHDRTLGLRKLYVLHQYSTIISQSTSIIEEYVNLNPTLPYDVTLPPDHDSIPDSEKPKILRDSLYKPYDIPSTLLYPISPTLRCKRLAHSVLPLPSNHPVIVAISYCMDAIYNTGILPTLSSSSLQAFSLSKSPLSSPSSTTSTSSSSQSTILPPQLQTAQSNEEEYAYKAYITGQYLINIYGSWHEVTPSILYHYLELIYTNTPLLSFMISSYTIRLLHQYTSINNIKKIKLTPMKQRRQLYIIMVKSFILALRLGFSVLYIPCNIKPIEDDEQSDDHNNDSLVNKSTQSNLDTAAHDIEHNSDHENDSDIDNTTIIDGITNDDTTLLDNEIATTTTSITTTTVPPTTSITSTSPDDPDGENTIDDISTPSTSSKSLSNQQQQQPTYTFQRAFFTTTPQQIDILFLEIQQYSLPDPEDDNNEDNIPDVPLSSSEYPYYTTLFSNQVHSTISSLDFLFDPFLFTDYTPHSLLYVCATGCTSLDPTQPGFKPLLSALCTRPSPIIPTSTNNNNNALSFNNNIDDDEDIDDDIVDETEEQIQYVAQELIKITQQLKDSNIIPSDNTNKNDDDNNISSSQNTTTTTLPHTEQNILESPISEIISSDLTTNDNSSIFSKLTSGKGFFAALAVGLLARHQLYGGFKATINIISYIIRFIFHYIAYFLPIQRIKAIYNLFYTQMSALITALFSHI